ncbi:hypothetical protein GCM10027346_19540 [Hymenobacter seoulensis]
MTTHYPLNCGKAQIISLDADEYGNYIALLSTSEVQINDERIQLHEQFRHPRIRELNAELFLIVEGRLRTTDNAHIFDRAGRKLLTFNAGDAIADVLIQQGQIVISYFDEGIGSKTPSRDGLAVFDFSGQQVFGYNSSQPYFILDCYCMTKQGKDTIMAYAYTDFHLIEVRLTDFRVIHHTTPADVAGAHAVTTSRGNIIFHSSYEEPARFFWWNKAKKVTRFGHHEEMGLRGIGNGKFLAFDEAGFSIVDAMEIMRDEHIAD